MAASTPAFAARMGMGGGHMSSPVMQHGGGPAGMHHGGGAAHMGSGHFRHFRDRDFFRDHFRDRDFRFRDRDRDRDRDFRFRHHRFFVDYPYYPYYCSYPVA